MQIFHADLRIPPLDTDNRNPFKMWQDLTMRHCLFTPPVHQLLSNHSFLTAPAGKTYEFGGISAPVVLEENPNATVGDLLKVAGKHDLHVVDQTIPFQLVDNLLKKEIRPATLSPLARWTFVANSCHSDGEKKPVLVTVLWPTGNYPLFKCHLDGFRPSLGDEVLKRRLDHQAIAGSMFVFERMVTQIPTSKRPSEIPEGD